MLLNALNFVEMKYKCLKNFALYYMVVVFGCFININIFNIYGRGAHAHACMLGSPGVFFVRF